MSKVPLVYTFGNHMHWVDMEWLWGYHVLPGSVRDMLRFCHETGAKGNVNFDGIGYEKLASEDPEAFQELREAVRNGTVELAGCSYGQPYGLFHGGESNVRQRVYGARAAMRLFGVRPRTFWEEEFDFFPQLPQVLRGVGYDYASLFFQWTWHTPEIPVEEAPVVWWESPDGSRVLTATRNRLNLHQWPEDMDILFNDLAQNPPTSHGPTPLILQWLELMPSPDWMCRSEVLLPKMRELLGDDRFEIRMATLGEYLESQRHHDVPARRYTMGDVWHGMSLGKNGDLMRRLSLEAESSALAAESAAALAGIFGRPYAQWDVYPTWELEEAWRLLLAAQHHDNDECEGLCGHVGIFQYEQSVRHSRHVLERSVIQMIRRVDAPNGIAFNPLGWTRRLWNGQEAPAFGLVALEPFRPKPKLVTGDRVARGTAGTTEVELDLAIAALTLKTSERTTTISLRDIEFVRKGERISFANAPVTRVESDPFAFELSTRGGTLWVALELVPEAGGVDVTFDFVRAPIEPDPGLGASVRWQLSLPTERLRSDTAYHVADVELAPKGHRKYPEGDWMTSPQWFESVSGAFTGLSFVDGADAEGWGVLVAHTGSEQWFRTEGGVSVVLHMDDPWDEDYARADTQPRFRLVPHGPLSAAELWRQAQEFRRPAFLAGEGDYGPFLLGSAHPPKDQPTSVAAVSCDAENVVLTAFHRETRDSAKGQERHAADLLGVDYPYVVRLVEMNGEAAVATLTFGATVAKAVRTNLLGEPETELEVIDQRQVKLSLRAHEIATAYVDLVEGRKQVRDLDAKREVWATVHRVDGAD